MGAREELYRKLGACSADVGYGRKDRSARSHRPGARRPEDLIYPLESSPQGTLVARLDIEDDFATDQAYLALSDRQCEFFMSVRGILSSQSVPFFPHLQVNDVRMGSECRPSHYDVVIFDSVPAPQLTHGNLF